MWWVLGGREIKIIHISFDMVLKLNSHSCSFVRLQCFWQNRKKKTKASVEWEMEDELLLKTMRQFLKSY